MRRVVARDASARHARRDALVLTATLLVVVSCAARRTAEFSGFLDDYSVLRDGGAGDIALVYRNPAARWTSYDKVLFEPVTLWRSGRNSLDPVPESDLLRLIGDLERTVRRRLGDAFRLVDRPEPGTMRIRLAITEARASDRVLDVMRARPDPEPVGSGGPLQPETRRFVEQAQIEGEIRDAGTGELLAAGVDRRHPERAPPLDTWAAVDRALDFWSERVCARLEARTRGKAAAPGRRTP